MSPKPFKSGAEFHRWLEANHDRAAELVVLLQKKDSGKGGITYAEALDEALCYGWIDGVRTGFAPSSYTIRFTPRRPGSIWSLVNVEHVGRLIREGRMQPAGTKAFEARRAKRTGIYSFENRPETLPPALEHRFRSKPKAWTFFTVQPPGYRRTVIWWVVSAKQEATRERRLARVIEESATQHRVDLLNPFRSSQG